MYTLNHHTHNNYYPSNLNFTPPSTHNSHNSVFVPFPASKVSGKRFTAHAYNHMRNTINGHSTDHHFMRHTQAQQLLAYQAVLMALPALAHCTNTCS